MNWWRAHHGIANDPKLALVAMSRHVTPCHATRGDVLAVWVSVLDFASQNEPRGSVKDIDCEQLSWYLEMPVEKVAAILEGFRDRRMIDGNLLAAWDKRQPKREREDLTAANRKRKQRQQQDSEPAHTQQTGASFRAERDTSLARDMTMFENGNVTPCHTMSPTEERRGEEIREEKNAASSSFEVPISNSRGDDSKNTNQPTTTRRPDFASERDELVAVIQESTGSAPDWRLLESINVQLELHSCTFREFIDDVSPRIIRLKRKPGPGFFLRHAETWGTNGAVSPRLKSATNASGRCEKCNGLGTTGPDEFCECAMGLDLKGVNRRKLRAIG